MKFAIYILLIIKFIPSIYGQYNYEFTHDETVYKYGYDILNKQQKQIIDSLKVVKKISRTYATDKTNKIERRPTCEEVNKFNKSGQLIFSSKIDKEDTYVTKLYNYNNEGLLATEVIKVKRNLNKGKFEKAKGKLFFNVDEIIANINNKIGFIGYPDKIEYKYDSIGRKLLEERFKGKEHARVKYAYKDNFMNIYVLTTLGESVRTLVKSESNLKTTIRILDKGLQNIQSIEKFDEDICVDKKSYSSSKLLIHQITKLDIQKRIICSEYRTYNKFIEEGVSSNVLKSNYNSFGQLVSQIESHKVSELSDSLINTKSKFYKYYKNGLIKQIDFFYNNKIHNIVKYNYRF